jgi:hypothetical protein
LISGWSTAAWIGKLASRDYFAEDAPVAREQNCLPRRIKAVLGMINRGDACEIARLIDESRACPDVDTCDVGAACLRIHAAFLPLTDKVPAKAS